MTQKLICPFCGNENPAENRCCEVCKANLKDLPSELRVEKEQIDEEVRQAQEAALNAENPNPDTVIPPWIRDRLSHSAPRKPISMPFDSYLDIVFRGNAGTEEDGSSDKAANVEENKTPVSESDPSQNKAVGYEYIRKEDDLPRSRSIESSINGEIPLIIPEQGNANTVIQNEEDLHKDFSVYRPERKWDDEAVSLTSKAEGAGEAVENALIVPDAETSESSFSADIDLFADFSVYRPANKWDDEAVKSASKTEGSAEAFKTADETENALTISDSESAGPCSPAEMERYKDFSLFRPADKWDDEAVSAPALPEGISREITPAMQSRMEIEAESGKNGGFPEKEDIPVDFLLPEALGANVASEPPLIEPDTSDPKGDILPKDDPALHNCASPTKLTGSEYFTDIDEKTTEEETKPSYQQNTLIAEFIRDFDSIESTSEPVALPEETVFFSSEKEDTEEEEEEETFGIPADLMSGDEADGENPPSNIDMLDEILRHEGWRPESEIVRSADRAEDNWTHPWDTAFTRAEGDTAGGFRFNEPQTLITPDFFGEEEPEKDELSEIPWNLFESDSMFLPHPPADSRRSAFRVSELPLSDTNTDTSLRMIRTILDRIVRSENQPHYHIKEGRSSISLVARCVLMALAVIGVLVALFGTSSLMPEAENSLSAERANAFLATLDGLSGETMIVVDYSPGMDAELTPALRGVVSKLKDKSPLSALVLKPMAMPPAQNMVREFEGSFSSIELIPSGAIAIQKLLAEGRIPPNVLLVTANIISVRNWAEQLYGLTEPKQLFVLGAAQINQAVRPYVYTGMVASALCESESRAVLAKGFQDETQVKRERAALWYLCLLAGGAYFCGSLVVFLKQEPSAKIKRHTEQPTPVFDFKRSESDL